MTPPQEKTYPCEICEGIAPEKMFLAVDFRDSKGVQTMKICEICADAFATFFTKLQGSLLMQGNKEKKLTQIDFNLIFEK